MWLLHHVTVGERKPCPAKPQPHITGRESLPARARAEAWPQTSTLHLYCDLCRVTAGTVGGHTGVDASIRELGTADAQSSIWALQELPPICGHSTCASEPRDRRGRDALGTAGKLHSLPSLHFHNSRPMLDPWRNWGRQFQSTEMLKKQHTGSFFRLGELRVLSLVKRRFQGDHRATSSA